MDPPGSSGRDREGKPGPVWGTLTNVSVFVETWERPFGAIQPILVLLGLSAHSRIVGTFSPLSYCWDFQPTLVLLGLSAHSRIVGTFSPLSYCWDFQPTLVLLGLSAHSRIVGTCDTAVLYSAGFFGGTFSACHISPSAQVCQVYTVCNIA